MSHPSTDGWYQCGVVGAAILLHLFLLPQHLKYHTQIHVRSRHGKNRGRKISGVEPLPGEDKVEREECVCVYVCRVGGGV